MRSIILRRWCVAAIVWLGIAAAVGAGEATVARRTVEGLAVGTPDATRYVVIDSGLSGPTVWVSGGVHGDEPAGYIAAEQISHWRPSRGRLVVLPRAHVRAIEAGKRLAPAAASPAGTEGVETTAADPTRAADQPSVADQTPPAERDLNRSFPKHDENDTPGHLRSPLAAAIWAAVKQQKPDWVIDLHEGYDFHQINRDSVGSSLILFPTAEADQIAPRLLQTLNHDIADRQKQFVRLRMPVDGSLARAAGEHLHAQAMILETTSKAQTLPVRVRQHRLMVHEILSHLGMTAHGPDVLTDRQAYLATPIEPPETPATRPAKRYVAVFNDGGVGDTGPVAIDRYARRFDDLSVTQVCAADVAAGALSGFDVAIFPGGSGSGQAKVLGDAGRDRIRKYVEGGGGYIGICAGSYLATSKYAWGLRIVDAHTIDTRHWARGKGTVQIELTDEGKKLLGSGLAADQRDAPRLDIRYANGPLLAPSELPDLPDVQPLAYFRSDMAKNGVPGGVMPGTPAAISSQFGKGRVICFSPHPEQTAGLEGLVRAAIDWTAGQNP